RRLVIFTATLDGNDNFVARQKLTGYVNRLIQQASRIATQIQNHLTHAVFLKIGNCLVQFVVGRMLKSSDQSDITGRVVDHASAANRYPLPRPATIQTTHRPYLPS